jgi:murein L,D-transpeptidase YcbB/YkuD
MESTKYDTYLKKDIRSFQNSHGLDVDGVIGKGTFTALNIPVEKKIDMLRVNLERARWIMHNVPKEFLIVNIARFKAYVIRNDSIIHRTNVMVGKTFHKTPIFRSKLQYIEFNPTWTVPVSITRNEMIPKMKKDHEYLNKKNMVLLDRSGNIVDQSQIDFSTISANNFPYTIRQEPGPWNALGEVKFIFPNKHSVYLHDTQSKSLFSRANRTFSHGCIRVQNPFDLAEVLLQRTDWNRDKIDELVASKETKRVFPEHQIDIFLLYWTTGLMDTDKIFYLPDVYERDQPILKMLDQKVKSVRIEDF